MRALGKNVFKMALLVIVLGQLAGCGPVIESALKSSVLSTLPTFETTEQTWPALSDETGRVVIYWPASSTAEMTLSHGNLAEADVGIDGDESKRGGIASETFVFVDLTPGQHEINFIFIDPRPLMKDDKVAVLVDARAGEIIYLKLHVAGYMLNPDPPVIVGAAEAREALKELRHAYKEPVPFTQQK